MMIKKSETYSNILNYKWKRHATEEEIKFFTKDTNACAYENEYTRLEGD